MIPVCTPTIGKKERQYVNDCLKTNWISSAGKYIEQFEQSFSSYCGRRYGITTTNGTTALHLALAAAGIGKGDEVIVPSFSIASTVFAVIYCGAKPVFADIEADTGNIDPSLIEKLITKKTKAIISVHIYGHPCDMDALSKISSKYKLMMIEDAAECHGGKYKNKKIGSFGLISCFSFYANKIITTGEGGMILTDDKRVAERAKRLKNLDFHPPRRFWHEEVGFNMRMTNLQAAIGCAQLERIETFIKARRRNAKIYNRLLKDVKGLLLPVERDDCFNVYWMYSIRVSGNFGCSRDQLIKELASRDIEARTYFLPLHQQPFLKEFGFAVKRKLPVTENWGECGLYLPSGSNLKKSEIETVCRAVRSIADKYQ